MAKENVELKNSVFWNHVVGDKVYMESVQIAINQFPFAMRQVFLRFGLGPDLDLSIYDMDRIVSIYLKLRGIRSPAKLGTAKEPECCDFLVPNVPIKKRRT